MGVAWSDYQGIIFDCDGTLIDSEGKALTVFIQFLTHKNLITRKLEHALRHMEGISFYRIMADALPGIDIFNLLWQWAAYERKQVTTLPLYPGVRSMLSFLDDCHNSTLGLFTAHDKATAKRHLAENGVLGFFSFLWALEHYMPYGKADVLSLEMLIRCFQMEGIQRSRLVSVGDKPHVDAYVAQKAGIAFIGIAHTDARGDEFMRMGVPIDHIFSAVTDVPP